MFMWQQAWSSDWQPDPGAGPIYLQIAKLVTERIALGLALPGEKLPSARQLATLLGVNPNTVVHAYAQLETAGISETRRGLGTFIRAQLDVASLRSQLLQRAARDYLARAAGLGVSIEEAVAMVREVADAGADG